MRGNRDGATPYNNTHNHDHCRPTNHRCKQLLAGKQGAMGRGGDGNDNREGETRGEETRGLFRCPMAQTMQSSFGPMVSRFFIRFLFF
jgi:hypothetical protein